MRRVLIGTVGYHNLRDYSIGPLLLPRLQAASWPAGVDVDEMNWGPIAIVQQFEALDVPYDRVVLLSARPVGRVPGTCTLRRWRGGLPPPDLIQGCIAEAITGVVSVDNLLVVGEHFGIWPAETFLVDVEPGPQEAGPALTPAVAAAVPVVLDVVRRAALAEAPALQAAAPMFGQAFGAYYAG